MYLPDLKPVLKANPISPEILYLGPTYLSYLSQVAPSCCNVLIMAAASELLAGTTHTVAQARIRDLRGYDQSVSHRLRHLNRTSAITGEAVAHELLRSPCRPDAATKADAKSRYLQGTG